ncbi:MAG: Formate dehydrogenase, nitrate-inducible, iron-sulfur subunit [Verrucomicrobiae bacterium]|nr:Formate dehydrogenase, nitrate-inducible, iron-sulfur subunit [Verrucomicrobiae bacterium]
MISRRRFLQASATGALTVLGARGVFAKTKADPADAAAVLVDLTRCIGCRACENACRVRAGFPGLPTAPIGYGAGDGQLTFRTRTFIDFRNGNSKQHQPVKRQCMHCLEPACVSVCPVAALEKTATGPVVYHENVCIGCRYCILACPFGVAKYEWDNALMPRVGKCDFCADRQAEGRPPACVAACPTGTLKFGTRGVLLQEARARMSAQPNRYVAIYGDEVVGGTSWIYLSATPPEELGFPKGLPPGALPQLTWKAIAKLPFVVIGVGLLLSLVVRWRTRSGHA